MLVHLKKTDKAMLWAAGVCMADHHLGLQLPSFQASRIVLGDILHVLQIRPLSCILYYLNLAWVMPQLPVFLATAQSKVHATIEHHGVKENLWPAITEEPLLPQDIFLLNRDDLSLTFGGPKTSALQSLHLRI